MYWYICILLYPCSKDCPNLLVEDVPDELLVVLQTDALLFVGRDKVLAADLKPGSLVHDVRYDLCQCKPFLVIQHVLVGLKITIQELGKMIRIY